MNGFNHVEVLGRSYQPSWFVTPRRFSLARQVVRNHLVRGVLRVYSGWDSWWQFQGRGSAPHCHNAKIIHIYIYMCVYICNTFNLHMYIYISMCVCIFFTSIYSYTCTYFFSFTYIIYSYIYMCVFIDIYICIYIIYLIIFIHINIFIYIYTYTHICIFRQPWKSWHRFGHLVGRAPLATLEVQVAKRHHILAWKILSTWAAAAIGEKTRMVEDTFITFHHTKMGPLNAPCFKGFSWTSFLQRASLITVSFAWAMFNIYVYNSATKISVATIHKQNMSVAQDATHEPHLVQNQGSLDQPFGYFGIFWQKKTVTFDKVCFLGVL